MFAALGAVPLVARDFVSSESDDFEPELLARLDLDSVFLLADLLLERLDLLLERLVFELRELPFLEPELREPEDLEPPSDLFCAIPPATIAPASRGRVGSRRARGSHGQLAKI